MTLIVDVGLDGARSALARDRVKELARAVLRAERVRDALVSITFVSSRRIAQLNRAHLGHAGPTDVISFGLTDTKRREPVLGDIYIAPDVARANARRFGTGVREELARLVVHGTLHVVGYDHPDDDRTGSPMWRRQETLLRRAMGRGGW